MARQRQTASCAVGESTRFGRDSCEIRPRRRWPSFLGAVVVVLALCGRLLANAPPPDEVIPCEGGAATAAPPRPPTGSTFLPSSTPGAIAAGPIVPRPGDPPVPAVAVWVRVPQVAAAGKPLTYRILAENMSRASAHHVMVKVTLPPGARFVRATLEPIEKTPVLTWKLDTLAPGGRREIDLVVVPEGMSDLACCARVQFEHGQCVHTRLTNSPAPREKVPPPPPSPPPVPAPVVPPPAQPTEAPPAVAVLQLRQDGTKRAPLYDPVDFKLVVTNTGKATAKNVVVEDTLSNGLEFSNSNPSTEGRTNPLVWKLGDLAPGASRKIDVLALAKEPGTLASTGAVSADGGLRSTARHEVLVGSAVLKVTMSGPKQGIVGRPATYVFTVANTGTYQAEEVELSDELPDPKKYPDAITFVSATDGGRLAGHHVRWNLGTLPPGQRRTVVVQLRSRHPGKFENVCQVHAARNLNEQDSTVTQFEESAALSLETAKNRNIAAVGEEASFTIRVFNGSKVKELGLSVTASLPDGLQCLNFKTEGQKIRFPRIAQLARGEEQTTTIRVRVVKEGEQRLQVVAISDRTGGDHPIKAEETMTVVPAATGSLGR
jgi:uncharacterized repeat protein (TIGR01451 family)